MPRRGDIYQAIEYPLWVISGHFAPQSSYPHRPERRRCVKPVSPIIKNRHLSVATAQCPYDLRCPLYPESGH